MCDSSGSSSSTKENTRSSSDVPGAKLQHEDYKWPITKQQTQPKQEPKRERGESIGLNLLPPSILSTRLNGLEPGPLNGPINDVVSVTRKAVSERYGGSQQTVYVHLKNGAIDYHVLFPRLEKNPNAPRRPGEPGLIYRTSNQLPWEDRGSRSAKPTNSTIKLLVQFEVNDYRYLGDYKLVPTHPLTQEEFRSLSYSASSHLMLLLD